MNASSNEPKSTNDAAPCGTAAYENWRAFLDGKPRLAGAEYVLYSDARVTGEVSSDLGPYQLLNLVPARAKQDVKPAIALRCYFHVDLAAPDRSVTDASRYHGGDIADELAALVSLTTGMRLRAMGPTRLLGDSHGEAGKPIAYFHVAEPELGYSPYGRVLANTHDDKSLETARGLREKLAKRN